MRSSSDNQRIKRMKLNLPEFHPNRGQRHWIQKEITTARFIQTLWRAASTSKRQDPAFVALIVKCGWTNVRDDGSGLRSSFDWRNRAIADYLTTEYESVEQLAVELRRELPRLRNPVQLLSADTGITAYYTALRPATIRYVRRRAADIASAFKVVAGRRSSTIDKIRDVGALLAELPKIKAHHGAAISPLSAITPALACLDPQRRFPIMNQRTRWLLQKIGERQDAGGAVALSKLIGKFNIRNSAELDVYANTADLSRVPTSPAPRRSKKHYRDVGVKSELASLARITANRVRIRKLHNALTNRFRDYQLWRHQGGLQESDFDALIPNWKKGRHLLIEAKTASSGPGGRAQIRQAIGQLFDYRFSHFPAKKVDLAVLLPKEPASDIKILLQSLNIECIWFKSKKLEGSIRL